MLLFLDESYEEDNDGGFRHVYAGFGIDEKKYRALVAAVYQSKQKYFLQVGNMTPTEIQAARKTHIVTAESPELAEIKGSKLLTLKQAEYHLQQGNANGILLTHDLLDALIQAQATVFGILSHPTTIAELQHKAVQLPTYFVRILERVELWMKEQDDDGAAVIVLDTVNYGIDRHLSEKIAEFLFRSQRMYRNFLFLPMF